MLFPDRTLTDRLQRALAQQHISTMRDIATALPDIGVALHPLTDSGGLAHAVSGGKVWYFTRISGLGLDAPATAEQLDRAEAFYTGRNEPCRIDIAPLSDPSLLELIRARRYILELFDSIYCRPLPAPNDDLQHRSEVHIRIVPRDDAAEIERTIDAIHRGFHGPDTPRDMMWRIAVRARARPSTTLFAAYLDGVDGPVGGGSLDMLNDPTGRVIAALGGAAVDERFRNRGVQSALIRARLAHARTLAASGVNCDLAMIVSRPGIASERNILRAGFQLVCTRARFTRELYVP